MCIRDSIDDESSLQLMALEDTDLRQKILRRLLNANQAIDVDELADEFYVSTSSLRNKLKEINKLICENDLQLIYAHNTVRIEGTELNKRFMIRKMIYADFPSRMMNIDNLADYFHDMDISSLYTIVLSSVRCV